MKLIQAYVNGNPRQVTTKYGSRSVMDIRLADGGTATIWGAANSSDILNRANGERVQVALDSKGKYHVVEHAGSAVATTQKPITVSELQPTYNSHNGRSAEIADYIERLSKLFRHCYNSVDGIGEKPDQRAIATTLFS